MAVGGAPKRPRPSEPSDVFVLDFDGVIVNSEPEVRSTALRFITSRRTLLSVAPAAGIGNDAPQKGLALWRAHTPASSTSSSFLHKVLDIAPEPACQPRAPAPAVTPCLGHCSTPGAGVALGVPGCRALLARGIPRRQRGRAPARACRHGARAPGARARRRGHGHGAPGAPAAAPLSTLSPQASQAVKVCHAAAGPSHLHVQPACR